MAEAGNEAGRPPLFDITSREFVPDYNSCCFLRRRICDQRIQKVVKFENSFVRCGTTRIKAKMFLHRKAEAISLQVINSQPYYYSTGTSFRCLRARFCLW